MKNDYSIDQPWKDISLKNDNSINQPWKDISLTIPLINVRSTYKLRASGCKARSAKNNLIDGLFSFSQLQNCANTFSSIFNVIHLHTELHTIKMYVEPILGLKY